MMKTATTEISASPEAIHLAMDGLSPKRRETLRLILENPREFVLLSVRAAAARLAGDLGRAVARVSDASICG